MSVRLHIRIYLYIKMAILVSYLTKLTETFRHPISIGKNGHKVTYSVD